MEMTQLQLQALGRDESSLVSCMQGDREFLLHRDMLADFRSLQQAAAEAGFDLQLISAYRGFERQLAIWNAKAQGERALLDSKGDALEYDRLSENEKLFAILRWSALPGLSRHHWGSDIDVFDASAMDAADVQLVPAEVEGDGPCAAMHEWLDQKIAAGESFGFFRPYQRDCGGTAPERWHLSYLPLAAQFSGQLSPEVMLEVWRNNDLSLLDALQSQLPEIWKKYAEIDLNGQPDWVVSVSGSGC